ncbi:AT-rich interactive domain-containing protein 3C-like [Sciurus carolinensis]|uniref:AT-rich interactive domain-containing protein 3C-like n=1 Tax=Sciurus carolinensis TaxID=30640 RepID=UPI001FB1E36B|nr:AT-rich interactive domain-containing protein 3C-like [Sciurus carolinensis]
MWAIYRNGRLKSDSPKCDYSAPSWTEERLDGPLNLAGSGISSINMALEINGVVYTGVLFARRQPVPASQGPTNPAPPPSTGPPSSTLP